MPKFEFFAIIALSVVAGIVSCEQTYDVKYDNVDVDEILKSERLLSNYIKCLMDEGPCTEDGRDLKDTLPDAITTDCSQCTEKQKEGSNKIMHFM
jgi:Insect pheromone-binding family, A10/OS-D